MKVLIYQKEKQIYKIEVYGHAKDTIACAGFSGAFNFVYGCLITISESNMLLSTKHNFDDLRMLNIFTTDEKTKWLLDQFKDYCLMLKDQYFLDLEVINEKN